MLWLRQLRYPLCDCSLGIIFLFDDCQKIHGVADGGDHLFDQFRVAETAGNTAQQLQICFLIFIGSDDENDDAEALQVTSDRIEEPELAPAEPEEPEKPQWTPPPIDLLVEDKGVKADFSESIAATKIKLLETLKSFGIGVKDIGYSIGPTITRYEVVPDTGVRVRAIANLVDDIAMNLATVGVRIEAPIPNKAAVGIEVPNKNSNIVGVREIIDSTVFTGSKSKLTVALTP